MRQKEKRIGIIAIVLLLFFCSSIYVAYRLHPESFKGKDEIITRGEYAAILANEISLDTSNAEKDPPSFSDIDGHFAEKYIEALVDAGIINPADYPDGFRPDAPITRSEIIKLLVKINGLEDEAKNTKGHSGYADQSDIKEDDKGYVIIGRENGIIGDEEDDKIRPNDPATKGEADKMNESIKPKPPQVKPTNPTQTPDTTTLVTTPEPITPTEPENPIDPTTTPEENMPPITPTPDYSGGSSHDNPDRDSYHPAAEVKFELPEVVHTDNEIEVMPVWKYMNSYIWTLSKTDVDGSEKSIEMKDAVTGTLGLEGGIIKFKEYGQYTLAATAKNARGKETVLSKQIKVYPVINMNFDLPETMHTDKSTIVTYSLENLYGNNIEWLATKDGEVTKTADITDGELGNEGGTFVFRNRGEYTLTACIKDATGRIFSHTESTKVYPVAGISFDLPSVSHTDKEMNLSTVLIEANNMKVDWILLKNGEVAELSTELEGKLTNEGGNIRFKDKGVYMLTGKLIDESGRTFETSRTITIYPVGSIGFYAPEITHTDKTIHVETQFKNLGDASIQWSLSQNGEVIEIKNVIEGELSDEGGFIRFLNKGEYVLKASFTDKAGRSYSYSAPVKVYPVPSISYALPETAHTDTVVKVVPEISEMNGLNVEWLLENGFGFQDFETYVSGTLENSGGSICFKHAGTYELIARITDETGRVFLFENGGKIEVLPVLNISFELPETTHLDRTLDLRTRGNNNVLPVQWSITKDSEAVDVSDVIDGDLNAYGGQIRFKQKGDYTLTSSMTDALGRVFSYTASTTAYPVPEISLSVPKTWYVGEQGAISVTGNQIENLNTEWTIIKDDGGAEDYTNFATGELNEQGGRLRFPSKGQYEIILTTTDPSGRRYVNSGRLTVYPIPHMNVTLTPLSYSGDTITAVALGSDLDEMDIEWLISVDGGEEKPYAQCVTGSLDDNGGSFIVTTDKTISLRLMAGAVDINGRKFIFTSNTASVKPLANFTFSVPQAVHVGERLNISMQSVSGLEGRNLKWSLSKDSTPENYSGTLSNAGGSIVINQTGSFVLMASTIDSTGREFSFSKSIGITNTAPNKPVGSAVVTRTALNSKLRVNISASATDPDSDAVTLEYSGSTEDNYYPVGTHIVKVRAKDSWGLYSEWTSISFTVTNSAPTTPVITRTPDGNSVAPSVPITITASSSDSDGDAITYVWEGRPSQTSTAYPLGKNVVRVKAVDSTGAESPWAAIVFFVADPNSGGGMTLSGPESVILEQGIAGATITNYTFTVPPVSGHSGQDYGRVRGYNVLAGQWDQLDYATTTNGITFSRALSPGIYSKLEFYYYTNHDCMYNKSNITYSVNFYFQ
ncbi:S-layer homology domain-containing protein [Anaerosolibacter sp.]|uniref:S-layer homology domain-containing protein n=1 Tax=Anaerosolibacter sp. TaxID=1872527 RepID=UPI0039EDF395